MKATTSNSGEVAVLVINHNGKQHLRECFSSLMNLSPINGYKIRVVCVDNGSTDGSLELVRQEFPKVEVISFSENYGFTGGYNRAVTQITSEYIALLNNDTEVLPDWLSELVINIKSFPNIAIVGSKVLSYNNRDVLQYSGGKFTILGSGFLQGLGQLDDEWSLQRYVGFVMGTSLLIKRDVFMELCGFDDRYFAYNEETDLCWRAWLAGYKVLYVPSAKIYHKLGSTGGTRTSPYQLSFSVKNRIATLVKNLELVNMIVGLLLTIVFEAYRISIFLKNKEYDAISAVLFKGLPDFLKELPNTLERRKSIQNQRKISDAELITNGALSSFKEAYKEYRRIGV